MRKFLAILCTVALIATLPLSSMMVSATESASVVFNPAVPVPGQAVQAVYSGTATAVNYGWYLFELADVVFTDSTPTGIKETANWTTASVADWDSSVDLAVSTSGKYLVCNVCDASWTSIVMSAPTLIAGNSISLVPNPPESGEDVVATLTSSETPTYYFWYQFDMSDIVFDGDEPKSIKEDADWVAAALPDYDSTLSVSSTLGDKYLVVVAGRADFTSIYQKAPVKIKNSDAPAPTAPPAPSMPTKKTTWFGFENVSDGVNIGVSGSDYGPTALRRPDGTLWNPAIAPWASTEYSSFTDLYQLNSMSYEDAPQGNKVGKWINKQGLTIPTNKGVWTMSLLAGYLEDPLGTYAVGATEFMFWVDSTNYVIPDDEDGNARDLTFMAILSTQVYDESGKSTPNYASYLPGQESPFYYKVGDDWVGSLVDMYGYCHIPNGYKGYVRIPLSGYEGVAWNPDGSPEVMQLNNVIQTMFYFYSFEGEGAMNSYALIDDLSFAGDNLQTMPLNYYQTELIPEDGIAGSNGVIDEMASKGTIGGTKAMINWNAIGEYSKSYTINLYKLDNAGDEIGTFVKAFEGLTDNSTELTGLDKNTMYAAQVIAYNNDGTRIAIYEAVTFKTTTVDDSQPTDDNPTTSDSATTTAIIATLLLGALIMSVRTKKVAKN